jgi:hypothetical protein
MAVRRKSAFAAAICRARGPEPMRVAGGAAFVLGADGQVCPAAGDGHDGAVDRADQQAPRESPQYLPDLAKTSFA